MPLFQLGLTIMPETGVSVGGSGHTGTRADNTILRDGQERPIMPASQVKGRLRHACEALVRAAGIPTCRPPNPEQVCPQDLSITNPPCLICSLFGSPWHASVLQFQDLVQESLFEAIRPGIGVERRRGIVQERLLFLTETTAPGSELFFYNAQAITGNLAAKEQALLLLAGLHSIRQWGGAKSRGLGWANLDCEARWNDQIIELDQDGKGELAEWLKTAIAS